MVFDPGGVILLKKSSHEFLEYVLECSFKLFEGRWQKTGEVKKYTVVVYDCHISIWLHSAFARRDDKGKIVIMEVGVNELLNEKISQSLSWYC